MTANPASTETQLLAIDAKVDQMASEGEFGGLALLLAEDFYYTHSTGASQDKDEWLASLKDLAGRRQRVPSSIRIEQHGDVAVAMGDLNIVWNDRPESYYRYVRVYRLAAGEWRVISQRTLPAPDRAPAGSK
jgi:hypothetical protein